MANWVSAGCGVIANELAQAMEKRGQKLYGVVNRTQEKAEAFAEKYGGVLPGHIPLTVIVKPGILHITEKDGEKEAALHSGFAEILPEGVTILAEIIEWPNEIDENRAEAALHRAEERLRSKTPETDIARAETALQRAMARIQVLR